LAAFPDHPWDSVTLWDHSPQATDFARKCIGEIHPGVACPVAPPDRLEPGALVLVSHALGEAREEDLRLLWERVREAQGLILVEPGTHESSHAVIAVREALKDRFFVRAPCTHEKACGLLTEENSRHWCHQFGRVPTEVFMDAHWAAFSRTLGIDLRSLPISYLALDKTGAADNPNGISRILGRPRFYKGFCRILSCQSSGVTELELPKRADKELWKTLKKDRHGGLFEWEVEGERIREGREVGEGGY
jgi:ribosomal protein RSM22 (predicted rRNA methylase)